MSRARTLQFISEDNPPGKDAASHKIVMTLPTLIALYSNYNFMQKEKKKFTRFSQEKKNRFAIVGRRNVRLLESIRIVCARCTYTRFLSQERFCSEARVVT